ncbi:hypothetical protein PWG14_20390 (plasmid) [Chromobacterium amazonense]|nr:hypothetical protein [Chromobacterium amazonense]MDE1714855.1 hypothetical protein [Chromobacterium amazonense]
MMYPSVCNMHGVASLTEHQSLFAPFSTSTRLDSSSMQFFASASHIGDYLPEQHDWQMAPTWCITKIYGTSMGQICPFRIAGEGHSPMTQCSSSDF